MRPLNELKLSLIGKITVAAIAAWLVGRATNLKLHGTPEQVRAVSEAMLASRRFQDALNEPGATVESVMQRLGLKHAAARDFQRVFGFQFPL